MKHWFIYLFSLLYLTSTAQDQTMGLFYNQPDAYNGYTLFSNTNITYLIDNCGFIVNEWESQNSTFGVVYLLEDGGLLRATETGNPNFVGGGSTGHLELFSWEGSMIWSYGISNETACLHHDIEPLPNGNILALVWEIIPNEEVMQLGRESDVDIWNEKIIEIQVLENNEAEIVWEWNLKDHLVQNQFANLENYGVIKESPHRVNFNYLGSRGLNNRDWVHLNSIDYNKDLDQILVSSKHLNEIWIIDHSTTTAEAASSTGGRYGKGGDLLYRYGNPEVYQRPGPKVLDGQHDATWISQEEVMVFNNNYNDNSSSIERWTLPTTGPGVYVEEDVMAYGPAEVDYRYFSTGFFSDIMSSVQMLPNGNLLICEGNSGTFFEVDKSEEEQWLYINPVNRRGGPGIQGGSTRQNTVFKIHRYDPDYPAFNRKDLTPGIPVELSPFESECTLNVNTSNTLNPSEPIEVAIFPNPCQNILNIDLNIASNIRIIDSHGKEVYNQNHNELFHTIEVTSYPSGLYLIMVESKQNIQVSKFFKP